MAIKKKIDMQGDVFSGISAVYAVKGGITTTAASGESATSTTVTLADTNMVELPVSEQSGFNFEGGTPSVSHFRIHGLNADWASKFTPGDGTLTLQIPCESEDALKVIYGTDGTAVKVTLPTGLIGSKTTASGTARSFEQKVVYLGLIVVNETEDKILFIKKAKFVATPAFDGGDTPYNITLTGALSAASDADSYGIFDLA